MENLDFLKTPKITNLKQFTRMVELLEQDPILAKGYSSGVNKVNTKEKWNKIGAQLNILGPPTRTGEGWMKVWADYKFKIKKKLIHNRAERRATGGGYFKQHVLSPTEAAAADLLQIDTIVNPSGLAFGIPRNDIEMNENQENEEPSGSQGIIAMNPTQNNDVIEEAHTPLSSKSPNNKVPHSRPFATSAKKAPPKKADKNGLLEDQLKVQTALYTEIKESLSEIKRYQRKNFNIKEEKLKHYKEEMKRNKEKFKLYKEDLKSQKEYRRELLKLRKEEIDIERRRIELDEIRNSFQG